MNWFDHVQIHTCTSSGLAGFVVNEKDKPGSAGAGEVAGELFYCHLEVPWRHG